MEKEATATGSRRRLLPLPVGKSFREEVAEHCYCVDKTLLIRDLLAARAGTALFTRPRRFGKTTAMQMLDFTGTVPAGITENTGFHVFPLDDGE